MHPTANWNDALTDAGAKPCPKCGKPAFFAAQDVEDDAEPRDQQADGQSGVWFCFACGHEQRALTH